MVTLTADLRGFRRSMSRLMRNQVPFAMSQALNDTAKDVLDDIKQEMRTKFDRPTRWTMNAFHVKYATKRRLVAVVQRKTPQAGKHYLEVQSSGGRRKMTGLEKLFASRLKYSGIVRTITPASGARLNSFGNWSPGQRNQVLSAIKAQRDSRTNTTKRSARRNKGVAGYFVPRDGSRLSPGVYQRAGKSGRLKKIVHISDKVPGYSKRLDIKEVALRRVRKAYPKHFARRFRAAVRTAR